MDKVFHVFVSSTYSDLINERKKVSEAVAKAGYVAEGMEIFPASSQHQMNFIERVIDRCDYYILVIAGRYGSVSEDGLSYTEKEYQYAKSKGIPVLAFIRSDLDELPTKNMEKDTESQKKLETLVESLKSSTMVDFWSTPDDLSTKALAALSQARVNFEGVGWIRADRAASSDILNEINTLRKDNTKLREELLARKPLPMFDGLKLASMDEKFEVRVRIPASSKPSRTLTLTWRQILAAIGPNFRTATNSSGVEIGLKSTIRSGINILQHMDCSINTDDKGLILMQMEALGMMRGNAVQLKNGGRAIFHQLTENGLAFMLRENVIKTKD